MGRAGRVKVGATLDPDLVAAVDHYVADHPELDRSKVIDEALRLWYAERQREAMERQYRAPRSPLELKEREAWKGIQERSARRIFKRA